MASRTADEAGLTPRKFLKKQRPTPEQDAENALETTTVKTMLKDQGHIFANLNACVCELMQQEVAEKDPRKRMKLLLVEGWMTDQGMVGTKTNELTLLWTAARDFKTSQCNNIIKNLNPDAPDAKIDKIEADTVEDLVIKTNAALKISEGAIKGSHHGQRD